jgi:hypothetical protein
VLVDWVDVRGEGGGSLSRREEGRCVQEGWQLVEGGEEPRGGRRWRYVRGG